MSLVALAFTAAIGAAVADEPGAFLAVVLFG